MTKLFTILLLSIMFSTISCSISTVPPSFIAKEVTEVWYCEDWLGGRNTSHKVLVTAKITSPNSGEIDVAGITYTALYRVQGFKRRWGFRDESEDDYSFVIYPSGMGYYYEFKDDKQAVEASLILKCVQK